MSTALSGHRLPPGAYPQNYNSRYADISYAGPLMRDAHEENPESILDDHVQRVMKTPGCQSPGTGRHSPKSRSPDGFPGGKGMGHGSALPAGLGKHPSKHGVKGESSHLYHHKHMHHFHHAGPGKPKDQVEAEAAMRAHGGIPWSMETSHYGSKSRSYADGMGSNPMEHTGYRYSTKSHIMFFPLDCPQTLYYNKLLGMFRLHFFAPEFESFDFKPTTQVVYHTTSSTFAQNQRLFFIVV